MSTDIIMNAFKFFIPSAGMKNILGGHLAERAQDECPYWMVLRLLTNKILGTRDYCV